MQKSSLQSMFLLRAPHALALALLAQPAVAQTTIGPLSPFALRLASSVSWDANVYRVSDSAPDPRAAFGVSGRSDRITSTTVGLLFDKYYAQQHLVANLGQTSTRYDKFGELDRDTRDYRVAWLWQLTPRISGTLSKGQTQSVVAFEDFTVGRQLVKTTVDTRQFTIDGTLFGGWHLLAGMSQVDSKNGQVFLAVPSSNVTNDEIGLRYIASSGSLITATQRQGRGQYPGQQADLNSLRDTGFKSRETEVAATWITTMRSTLNGRLTRTERRYDQIPQLNYAGVGGEFRYSWTPTGRLTINVSAQRAFTPIFQLATATAAASSRRVENTIAITPTWQVSEKVSLSMGALRQVSDYPALGIVGGGPQRQDSINRLNLGARWSVNRKVSLDATLQRDRRSSNVPGFDYKDTLGGLNALLVF